MSWEKGQEDGVSFVVLLRAKMTFSVMIVMEGRWITQMSEKKPEVLQEGNHVETYPDVSTEYEMIEGGVYRHKGDCKGLIKKHVSEDKFRCTACLAIITFGEARANTERVG